MKPIPAWNCAALRQSPFFAPLHPVLTDFHVAGFPTLADCNALLAGQKTAVLAQSGAQIRFVAQEYGKLPFARQYEPRCYLQGEVPTRADNWHDLLNALVWLAFPQTKAMINARHYQALIQAADSSSQRGAVRDVNTLLDESGVIVPYANTDSGIELAKLLRDFKWKALFWQHREQVRPQSVQQAMDFYIFGHGLYEKALQPYIGMTGQGLLLAVEPDFFHQPQVKRVAYLDALLAKHLADPEHCRHPRDLSPVPILGVPSWAADNENQGYYDNTAYFRSGRR